MRQFVDLTIKIIVLIFKKIPQKNGIKSKKEVKMKKALAVTIAAVICISIFTFNAHPFKTIAQAAVNENNISVMNSNVEPTVQSVNLKGINAAGIKQTDVTEYYKNRDSITNLLSTATPTPGETTWAKTYGGTFSDSALSIQQTSDGGYIVTGDTLSFGAGGYDFLVIKLDGDGAVTWAKTYGGSSYDAAYSIQQTSDGGYIVTGETLSFGAGDYDLLVIKLDSSGEIGGNCDYLQNCSPTVHTQNITGVGQTLSISEPTGIGANANVTSNNPDVQTNMVCLQPLIITASAGSGGSISPSGSVGVDYGGSQTFTITPDAGYTINKILVDGSPVHFIHTSGDIYTFTNVTSNHTISATFIPKPISTFVVEASVSVYGGYATVTPKEQTVQSGNSAKITINLDAGYHITEVTDNGKTVPMTKIVENANGTYTYTILAVYENHKINVTLEKNEYTIKAKTGEGGTISPSGNVTVKYNSTQSFTITPDPGYKIDKIIVDGKTITSTEQEYRFMNIKGNHTIEVTFAKLPAKTSLLITLQINNPYIAVNGTKEKIDPQGSKPIIRNNRTLLPIRSLIEALGGTVEWNTEKREVTITLNGNTIVLTIGKNTALVNGIKTSIDPHNSNVVPIIINGRTYLPLRFIAEHLNCTVDWDPKNREITIYYWG